MAAISRARHRTGGRRSQRPSSTGCGWCTCGGGCTASSTRGRPRDRTAARRRPPRPSSSAGGAAAQWARRCRSKSHSHRSSWSGAAGPSRGASARKKTRRGARPSRPTIERRQTHAVTSAAGLARRHPCHTPRRARPVSRDGARMRSARAVVHGVECGADARERDAELGKEQHDGPRTFSCPPSFAYCECGTRLLSSAGPLSPIQCWPTISACTSHWAAHPSHRSVDSVQRPPPLEPSRPLP